MMTRMTSRSTDGYLCVISEKHGQAARATPRLSKPGVRLQRPRARGRPGTAAGGIEFVGEIFDVQLQVDRAAEGRHGVAEGGVEDTPAGQLRAPGGVAR